MNVFAATGAEEWLRQFQFLRVADRLEMNLNSADKSCNGCGERQIAADCGSWL
jgi:hypothetical protein